MEVMREKKSEQAQWGREGVNNEKRLKNTEIMMQTSEGLSAERSRSREEARKEGRINEQLDMRGTS